MSRHVVPTVLVSIALASPCAAQIALPAHILPVMAKTSGVAGTDWVSSLSISNIGTETVDITALFFRENQDNFPLFVPNQELTVAPGATHTVSDVIGSWFPTEGDTKGFVVLYGEADGTTEDPFVLTVAGRIFNRADPDATYGQTVPAGELGLMVAPGISNLTGARWDDAVRSNVGVVNLSILPIDVIVTTYSADGTVLAAVNKRVRAFSLAQWSLPQLGVDTLVEPGRIAIEVDPTTITWDPCLSEELELDDLQGIFMSYLSRVDQATGDAEFVLGQSDWYEYLALCGDILPVIPTQLLVSDR